MSFFTKFTVYNLYVIMYNGLVSGLRILCKKVYYTAIGSNY